jgi:hypothetical protein
MGIPRVGVIPHDPQPITTGGWSEQPMHDALQPNRVTVNDVGLGLGTAIVTTGLATVAGGVLGTAIGATHGGIGVLPGVLGGTVMGLIVGAGAGVAGGGTITAMRNGNRDLTTPGAIAGAIGGAGALALLMRPNGLSGAAALGAAAVLGAGLGAVAGSIAD